jgi:hypothetical protein
MKTLLPSGSIATTAHMFSYHGEEPRREFGVIKFKRSVDCCSTIDYILLIINNIAHYMAITSYPSWVQEE